MYNTIIKYKRKIIIEDTKQKGILIININIDIYTLITTNMGVYW